MAGVGDLLRRPGRGGARLDRLRPPARGSGDPRRGDPPEPPAAGGADHRADRPARTHRPLISARQGTGRARAPRRPGCSGRPRRRPGPGPGGPPRRPGPSCTSRWDAAPTAGSRYSRAASRGTPDPERARHDPPVGRRLDAARHRAHVPPLSTATGPRPVGAPVDIAVARRGQDSDGRCARRRRPPWRRRRARRPPSRRPPRGCPLPQRSSSTAGLRSPHLPRSMSCTPLWRPPRGPRHRTCRVRRWRTRWWRPRRWSPRPG